MTKSLGCELHVQGRLHKFSKRERLTLAKAVEESARERLEEGGDDRLGEGSGGGGDFGVYVDEKKEGIVNIRANLGGARDSSGRGPGRGGNGGFDDVSEAIDGRTCVRLEKLGVDLGEDIVDGR